MARAETVTVFAALAIMLAPTFALDTSAATLGAPTGLTVSLEYVVSGQIVDPKPCNYSDSCVPALATNEDKNDADAVVVTYTLNMTHPNITMDNNTGIALRACFSPASLTDRPWRVDKKVVNPSTSAQCKFLMTSEPLPFGNGTFTWKLPNNLPAAVYNVRAYTVCGTTDGNVKYCAWGQSPGYFSTTMWDTTPGWLIATTVPLICLGPTLLVAYGGGHYIKKRVKGGSA